MNKNEGSCYDNLYDDPTLGQDEKEYFLRILKEQEAGEVKDRKCKYCGTITKRTLYGLCSACCRFN